MNFVAIILHYISEAQGMQNSRHIIRKKQLKFCHFLYKSGAVTHTTIVSESCLSLEAMNSSICIHMVKIIEVEKLEYAFFFQS